MNRHELCKILEKELRCNPPLRVRAIYTGEDGSMGFKNGRHYRIFISRGNGRRTVVVRTEEGLLRCPYYSMMSVLQYWKIIEIGW